MEEKSLNSRLSLQDTLILKGIALLLLLCHHCWSNGEYKDVIFMERPLFASIGGVSKLCVAIFVFLSGYGLTVQCLKNHGINNLIGFYQRRYLKLMTTFWLIWLLFVPIGVFVFHRTFSKVYGEHYILRAIVDLLGFCSTSSYNATWWFYGCIILLYLLYPLIWRCRRYWMLMLPMSFMIADIVRDGFPFLNLIGSYFFVFVCGFVYAYVGIPVGGG